MQFGIIYFSIMFSLLIICYSAVSAADQENFIGKKLNIWYNNIIYSRNPLELSKSALLFTCSLKMVDETYDSSFSNELEHIIPTDSGIELQYNLPQSNEPYCRVDFSYSRKSNLKKSLTREPQLQILVEDLSTTISIGYYNKDQNIFYLYSCYTFSFLHKTGNIFEINVEPSEPIDLDTIDSLDFKATVKWYEVANMYSYLESKEASKVNIEGLKEVMWMNCFMVIGGCLWVASVVKEGLLGKVRENGVEGARRMQNQFLKTPSLLHVFAVSIATGWHFIAVILVVIFINQFEIVEDRKSITFYVFVSYIVFAGLAGGFCGSVYTRYKGNKSMTAMILSLPLPLFFGFVLLVLKPISNFAVYSSKTTLIVLLSYLFLSVPLYVAGFIVARIYRNLKPLPIAAVEIHRNLYNSIPLQDYVIKFTMTSFLPFVTLYPFLFSLVESSTKASMNFNSDHQLSTFILFSLSSACVSIASSSELLRKGDGKWQWTSYLSSGFVGMHILLYSTYLYIYVFDIKGLLQFLYYIGYSLGISLIVATIGGAIGYSATSYLVHRELVHNKAE